jgi:hypothetical protein
MPLVLEFLVPACASLIFPGLLLLASLSWIALAMLPVIGVSRQAPRADGYCTCRERALDGNSNASIDANGHGALLCEQLPSRSGCTGFPS